jgi:ribosome-associated protein
MGDVADLGIGEGGIRLGELLKLTGLCESGGEAKARIAAGEVEVNGEVEQRRGRQLRVGDVVDIGGERVRLVQVC